ncbi:MAG TPA: tetratricopeptide repeat protein [Cytophagaceae bacterium]
MKYFFLVLLLIASQQVKSQNDLINDTETHVIIHKVIDHTYNFEFDKAKSSLSEIKPKYGHHPVYEFLDANIVYWDMVCNNTYKEKNSQYLALLSTSLSKANSMLRQNAKDVEGVFFSMASESAIALYYAERNDHLKAINHVKKAYSLVKEGFKLKEQFVEFYFTTGLYNYYVEQYPETRPIFKPFMIFFSKGDKTQGLKELDHTSKNGIFTKTEALSYLSNIYLKYEDQPEKALQYSSQLVNKYPNNYYFHSRHVEGLIFTGQYKQAEVYAYKLYKTGKKSFIFKSYIFYGLLNELHFKDYETSRKYYQQALNLSKELTAPDNDYLSFAYAGLARLAEIRGDRTGAINYYKKAQNIAEYTRIKKEAKEFLNKYD